MGPFDKFKYGVLGAAILALGSTGMVATGWGQAAAPTAATVVVTNAGTQAVPVQQQGTENVNVTNGGLMVSTRPAGSAPWHYFVSPPDAGIHPIFVPPAGKTALALTTLTVANVGATSEVVNIGLFGNAKCGSPFIGDVTELIVPPADTISQAFPEPIVITAGRSNWCLTYQGAPADLITLVGYEY